jgi:hypothetical protein
MESVGAVGSLVALLAHVTRDGGACACTGGVPDPAARQPAGSEWLSGAKPVYREVRHGGETTSIYVGAESSGLSREEAGVNQWQALTDGMPPSPQARASAIPPDHPEVICVGT